MIVFVDCLKCCLLFFSSFDVVVFVIVSLFASLFVAFVICVCFFVVCCCLFLYLSICIVCDSSLPLLFARLSFVFRVMVCWCVVLLFIFRFIL